MRNLDRQVTEYCNYIFIVPVNQRAARAECGALQRPCIKVWGIGRQTPHQTLITMVGEEQAGSRLFHRATVYQFWLTSPTQRPPGPRPVLELGTVVSPAVAEDGDAEVQARRHPQDCK